MDSIHSEYEKLPIVLFLSESNKKWRTEKRLSESQLNHILPLDYENINRDTFLFDHCENFKYTNGNFERNSYKNNMEVI